MFKLPIHKDCINFENGYCRLFNIPVDPNGPACPNFKPRIVREAQTQFMRSYEPSAVSPPSIPYNTQPRRVRARRRLRRRRGRRFGSLWWWSY